MRTALLFLASVAAASAWAGVLAPSAHMNLRTMRCREGSCATAAVVESADGASGMTDALRLDRRAMLKFASKVAATPPLLKSTSAGRVGSGTPSADRLTGHPSPEAACTSWS